MGSTTTVYGIYTYSQAKQYDISDSVRRQIYATKVQNIWNEFCQAPTHQ